MANTLLNTTNVMIVSNQSAIPLVLGDVVVPSAAADRAVTTTTDPNYAGLVGVVVDPGGIAVGERGAVAFKGYAPQVNLINTASRLDELTTSASPGKGQANPGAINSFGIAMTSASDPEAYLYGPSFRESASLAYGDVGGRLTLTTGVPVISSDVTGAATLYYTPYLHNQIGLYAGGSWGIYTTDEVSISLASLTDATNYDVFAYYTGSAVALELVAWASDTARATALARQDGVWTKNGDATRRYLGTIRASGTGTCEDSAGKRFVWNAYNQVRQRLSVIEATEFWSYTTNAWQMANNSAANRVEVVVGLVGGLVDLSVVAFPSGAATGGVGVAISEDAPATPVMADQRGGYTFYMTPGTSVSCWTHYTKRPAIGYHYYQWVEWGRTGLNWYAHRPATGGDPDMENGLIGWFEG